MDAIALTHLDTAGQQPLRLCNAYLVDGRRVDRLTAGPCRDLARQERLTRMLLRARPEYTDPAGPWPAVVREALGIPVRLLSAGPTSADKTLVSRPARPATAAPATAFP
ncbi:MAG TPA: hypothetical protein VNF47_14315 [Streptosporangiaceae bacterium]|nr:hypothetical protein [Streptosporangiaceae bacterium]